MIDLRQGDCLEVMKSIPDDSVDMVLADPPYGMSFQSGRRKVKHRAIENDDTLLWIDDFMSQCSRIAKGDTAHYFFCSWHNVDIFKQAAEKYFKVKNVLVWVKNNHGSGDLLADYAPKHELVLFCHKGRRKYNGKRECNILEFAKTNNALHPTQKPVDMLEFMIEKFSDEGQVVIDPFMGSGSTGVACVNTNRKFIGIELDETYFKVAQSRINGLPF